MPTGKISKRLVDGASASEVDTFIWDEALKGFGLKVTKGGAKTYLIQYRIGGRGSATKRHTIGRHGSPWTPTTAREEAERLLSKVAVGTDPRVAELEQKRSDDMLAFDQYLERYLREYGSKRWRSTTYPTVASNLQRYVVPVLGRKPISRVTRSDLLSVIDSLPEDKPALPRNVYAHASRLFSWAVEKGDIDRSPFDSLKAPSSIASRDRVLADEELRQIWLSSGDLGYPFGPMVRLLMLTGQRRGEVAELNWAELDQRAREWTIPAERAKNKLAHIVPLSYPVISLLDDLAAANEWPKSGLVLTTNGKAGASGYSRAKERLDRLLRTANSGGSLTPWRLHDLRRTLATGFQRLGIRFEVTEAVLNHISGARSGVAGIYQRHSWREEKQEALQRWAAHVAGLVETDG